MKTEKEFKIFVERLEDAADYDDVAVYLALKRWSRFNYGDNPPACVRRTLTLLRSKFDDAQIARLIAVPKNSARGLANEHEKE